MTNLVVNHGTRDSHGDMLAVFSNELGRKILYLSCFSSFPGAHCRHHAPRLTYVRIDSRDMFAADLGERIAQSTIGAVIIKNDLAFTINSNDNIKRAGEQMLEIDRRKLEHRAALPLLGSSWIRPRYKLKRYFS